MVEWVFMSVIILMELLTVWSQMPTISFACKIKVNNFRPYLGFGYGGKLSNRSDRNWISFDCGAMFVGGTPRIITHDGVDLAKDVKNILEKWAIMSVFSKQ